MDTNVTLTREADGYAYATGIERFVVSLSNGFPNAGRADVSIEPPNDKGVFARVSVGNKHKSKWFSSFEEAANWVDRFINPPENRRLSSMVRNNGQLIVSKYDGTDCLGQRYSAGDSIYYYTSTHSNAKYILVAG